MRASFYRLPTLFLLHLLVLCSLSAQEVVMPRHEAQASAITRAVVVGISDYQDNAIPDLRFAHRDAEAFAAWLRSPAGGNVPGRNLVLLTNHEATFGQVWMALYGLVEETHEGDEVLIYFSGHGDVESQFMSQPGFLLCHDSKASVYMAAALNIGNLQEVVNTLAVVKKAHVLLITDACRAGKLAGSSINGAQLTNANLANQFENATKVLSCEPNESSLESEEWGGGRGLFSYHLVDGLTGLADANEDGLVLLREIQRYLQDKVTTEAEPASQNPLVVGSAAERLAIVDAPSLAALKQERSGQRPGMLATDMKGWEDDLVAGTDSATQVLYANFKNALAQGALLDRSEAYASAWALLPQLLQRESLRELHGLLRRNLAAALLDEAQQALNALLDDDPYEVGQWLYNREKYARYPEYLDKAIELLGEEHYLYRTMMANKLFFETRSLANLSSWYATWTSYDEAQNRIIRSMLNKALQYEPDAAYLYYALGNSWFNSYSGSGLDSFFYCHHQALRLSPSWLLPRLDIINSYRFNLISTDWTDSKKVIQQGLMLKPNAFVLLNQLGWLYPKTFQVDSAIAIGNRLVTLRPQLPDGYMLLIASYMLVRNYDKAEENIGFLMALQDSGSMPFMPPWFYGYVGKTFFIQRKYEDFFRLVQRTKGHPEHLNYSLSTVFNRSGMFGESNDASKQVPPVDSREPPVPPAVRRQVLRHRLRYPLLPDCR